MYTELLAKTKMLKDLCDQSLKRLEEIKQSESYEVDFYKEVKPFVDDTMAIADNWRELAVSWINKEFPKNLHPNQIDATHENIQHISIQSFYQDTKVKRFKNMYESVQYVLENILEKVATAK
ncbi:YppE family protein [Fredinandcohnia sp. QZ13]|uniref:YppE family protein n=1 Tax=Fredinandcohnia sp. QZ13 TaxID=3073144 RepID=UPI00285337A2|nr:YppE family protein [Fredinandcohnia sp. QZ13]MDR4888673.1 YppE family protein [Fredinandcohnia sp. QZ13]